ncbi:hypothetical protein [Mucilaginibacter sp.]|uniref:hypothetical protein n=1 Tax=Mucilaginibacter sp. TaxID=1882438 RepID=UPI00262AF3C8|nr:hypothetical protein [Mucilaginibacter sp.]MDB5130124.1 hypothetical protein [Mucilaginibacter sp.]
MKIIFKWKATFAAVLLLSIGFTKTGQAQQKFEKKEFYEVMSAGETDAINKQIEIVKTSDLANKEGYEGALLMRKAGKVHVPKKKLGFFKEGRIKLETAIIADAENTEFRFLRLAIEENAPKIVKYHNDIEKDKLFIQKNFKNQPQSVQHAIIEYCKKSKVLHAEDL